jgi:peptidoglycan/xylan/chitin deacetylase (PgdA/CDA1 family)
VALTFDDGNYDFLSRAHPVLEEFGFPATLYLTTFYSQYNRPVFDVAVSYLVWRGRDRRLDLAAVTGQDLRFDLSSAAARASAVYAIFGATKSSLTAEEKDEVVAKLARELHVDYDELRAKRLLHLLTPEEASGLASSGLDIQLHTHRHRMPSDRGLFRREIEDNRRVIREITGEAATHFCYPSGVYDPTFLPWLRELGVESATTCEPGFSSRETDPLLLPRLVDSSAMSEIEFEGWITGVATAIPRRREA